MAVSWARRIGNIRTPMPVTNAELSSISAARGPTNAVEPLRSPERTMPVAMRLPTPYAKKPARKRTPTIRAVRRTLESGRTTGGGVAWLEAGFRSNMAMVSHPVRTQMRRVASEVDGARQPPAALLTSTTATLHPTPADRQSSAASMLEVRLRILVLATLVALIAPSTAAAFVSVREAKVLA